MKETTLWTCAGLVMVATLGVHRLDANAPTAAPSVPQRERVVIPLSFSAENDLEKHSRSVVEELFMFSGISGWTAQIITTAEGQPCLESTLETAERKGEAVRNVLLQRGFSNERVTVAATEAAKGAARDLLIATRDLQAR